MDVNVDPTDGGAVKIVLEGGPADLPGTIRTQNVAANLNKIKVRHGGGYEHFERRVNGTAPASGEPVVFCWTMRTRVAE